MRLRQVVIAARHDMQPRVGNALLEMPAHGERADGVGVAPDQQRGRGDAFDRQVAMNAASVIQPAARGNDWR